MTETPGLDNFDRTKAVILDRIHNAIRLDEQKAATLGVSAIQLGRLHEAFAAGIFGENRDEFNWVDEVREVRADIGSESTLEVLSDFTGEVFPVGTTLSRALWELRRANPLSK